MEINSVTIKCVYMIISFQIWLNMYNSFFVIEVSFPNIQSIDVLGKYYYNYNLLYRLNSI